MSGDEPHARFGRAGNRRLRFVNRVDFGGKPAWLHAWPRSLPRSVATSEAVNPFRSSQQCTPS